MSKLSPKKYDSSVRRKTINNNDLGGIIINHSHSSSASKKRRMNDSIASSYNSASTEQSFHRLFSMMKDCEDTDTVVSSTNSDDASEDDPFEPEERMDTLTLPKGMPDGFYVVKLIEVPMEGFDLKTLKSSSKSSSDHGKGEKNGHIDGGGGSVVVGLSSLSKENLDRSAITSDNCTAPVALMLMDPEEYPSLSRARKACRKGNILVRRGPLRIDDEKMDKREIFDPKHTVRARVGDRVYPGDIIGKQLRIGDGCYPSMTHPKPFDLPVVYEDDHFAIVNKPAGVPMYPPKNNQDGKQGKGPGRMTVRSALPFALTPPRVGTMAIIRRPVSVHRLDKPTSGLVLVAKTKPAMVHLSQQFVNRKVKKTYTAIVNGIPDEPTETRLSSQQAYDLGLDVPKDKDICWQIIDQTLEGKSALTLWRPLEYVKSLKAKDGILTLVELKPMTGRHHQLRRHMSQVKACPLVGDSIYDGGGNAVHLRERGLFLCSNKIILEHPYYNTDIGKKEWLSMGDEEKYANGKIRLAEDGVTIQVHASIELPNKFRSFLSNEGERASKFSEE
eukprot:CAMPEP_0184860582 /NCGR_PEP_ID=MMETSP0580-20130426/5441_1 /TAXON_ID=1118495 /ORGANISM="Dactyliosolen fragilissimus" /LENGTH=557 /DNA_ID=CAMNT_0027357737 /DNA_START=150 /DNA_END=1823 /DNA_ORIENTATION=-